jgi:hypothetical protein
MTASIKRLAIANPAAGATGTKVFDSDSEHLVSVIVTNKSSTVATFSIWIAPAGVNDEAGRGYIAKEQYSATSNSFETFKFPLNIDDDLYVAASTANLSFTVVGVDQLDL